MKKFLLFRHPSELLQSRTEVLRIYVTDDVKKEIEELAADEGLKAGQFLYQVLMGFLYHAKYRNETTGGELPEGDKKPFC